MMDEMSLWLTPGIFQSRVRQNQTDPMSRYAYRFKNGIVAMPDSPAIILRKFSLGPFTIFNHARYPSFSVSIML